MKKILKFLLRYLLGLFIIAACVPASGSVSPASASTPTPQVVTEKKTLPTPMTPDQTAVYGDLQVTMKDAEITSGYLTEYGTEREPPAGKNIIWIHILLKNMGQAEQDLPEPEHFSVLNGTNEFKATYGHRKDHADYMALTPTLVQGQDVNAWLRFDIPIELVLEDLKFVFLPESSQVSFGSSLSDNPWDGHPIYFWNCLP
jgi:hypothetical protein